MVYHNLNNHYKKTQTLYLAIIAVIVAVTAVAGYLTIRNDTDNPTTEAATPPSATIKSSTTTTTIKPTTTVKVTTTSGATVATGRSADTKTRPTKTTATFTTRTSKLVCVAEPITPDKLAETHPDGNPCSPVGNDETCVSIGTIILKPEDIKGTYYCTPTYQ